jgi:hypothetical protein
MEITMHDETYRLVKRGNYYYAHHRKTGARKSLKTADITKAKRLLNTENAAEADTSLNREKAKVYLRASDPKLKKRTWAMAMEA